MKNRELLTMHLCLLLAYDTVLRDGSHINFRKSYKYANQESNCPLILALKP